METNWLKNRCCDFSYSYKEGGWWSFVTIALSNWLLQKWRIQIGLWGSIKGNFWPHKKTLCHWKYLCHCHCYSVKQIGIIIFGTCATHRVSTPQGKQEKMVKNTSRQEKHREFSNFGKREGKHREFENLKREFQYQEYNCRTNYCMMQIKWHLKFEMHR